MLRRRHRTARACSAGSRPIPGCTSTRSSRCSTAAAARVSCATSSACCRRATCSSARWRWRATKARRGACCSPRLPTLEQHDRLAGHTGGNLLLSMMEQYSGDFLAAVDGLRGLLGCRGRVWPVSVEPASICAEYGDGSQTRGEVEVDAGQTRRPPGAAPLARAAGGDSSRRGAGHPRVRRRDHRPRQLLHQPDAAAARARREGSAGRHARAGHPHRQPAHRRARHGRASPPPMPRAGCRARSTGPWTS